MKILITDPISEEGVDYLKQQPDLEVVCRFDLSLEALFSEIRDAEGLIVRSKTQVTQGGHRESLKT